MSLFDLSSDGFPWRAPRPHEIETRRAQLSDLLIFDILLSSGGVRQPDTLWPPTDPASLRRLLEAIEESTYDTLKKDCLIYFLLKWHQDGREERFREDRCIPPQFAMLSDAYWHLDSGIHVEVRNISPYTIRSHLYICTFLNRKPCLYCATFASTGIIPRRSYRRSLCRISPRIFFCSTCIPRNQC
jgi:hypothetical protein